MTPRIHCCRGFSLTELAIVLVIVALLTGGLMVSLSSQQDARNYADTQRQLVEIKETLLGFTIVNGRLPCPAKPSIVTGVAGAGSEDCTLEAGVVPWAVLGVPETDPWGNRLSYRTKNTLTDSIAANTVTPASGCSAVPTQSSFALCSEGDLTVGDGATTIASKLPAVVISHGKNGRGAYRPDGTQAPGALNDELENADGDKTFVAHTLTGAGTTTEYDDAVMWIPLNILLSRMVAVGKLP